MNGREAKEVIIKGSILFANETEEYGDCDEDGPTELFYTLYLVVKEEDGTWTNYKFYREVFYMHGDSCAAVDYDNEELTDYDNRLFNAIHDNISTDIYNEFDNDFDNDLDDDIAF